MTWRTNGVEPRRPRDLARGWPWLANRRPLSQTSPIACELSIILPHRQSFPEPFPVASPWIDDMKNLVWLAGISLVSLPSPAGAGDTLEPLLSGLKNPAAVVVGPDGRVYLSVG